MKDDSNMIIEENNISSKIKNFKSSDSNLTSEIIIDEETKTNIDEDSDNPEEIEIVEESPHGRFHR